MSRDDLLIVADSERDANMLFAVGIFAPDPFIYLRLRGRSQIVIADMEVDRARRSAPHCQVQALDSQLDRLLRDGVKAPNQAHVIAAILRDRGIRKVAVPASFPHGLARELRDLKIRVKVPRHPLFPERETKTAREIEKINASLIMAEVGLAEAIQALKASKMAKDGRLMHHQVPLTAEKLRSVIDIAILQAGGVATRTIVASGRQACDPQEPGHGVLRANQPIVIHVFPRSQKTGYFGAIARTVVKGRASESLRKLYHSVAQAQEVAFGEIRDARPAREVHRAVQKYFEGQGYRTSRRNGKLQGFFHATGHGVGLDVQEPPRICTSSKDILRTGQVVTVEPGLYYSGVGAVRLEDLALVTAQSPRNLTQFEKVLEL